MRGNQRKRPRYQPLRFHHFAVQGFRRAIRSLLHHRDAALDSARVNRKKRGSGSLRQADLPGGLDAGILSHRAAAVLAAHFKAEGYRVARA